MKRLAIITTHPIQYNAPLFELLTKRNNIDLKVFYTWGESVLDKKYDPGFHRAIQWDIPLLSGYNYEFLANSAKAKGSHHFHGIINPSIIRSVENYKPYAVLVYGWAFNSHLKVLRYFKNKIPVMFRGDSTLLDESGPFSKIKRKIFLRWVYSYVDTALYVGRNNFDYFRSAGMKKKQLVFAPHAVDNERFSFDQVRGKNDEELFRKQLGIPAGDFVFLFAGKLEAKKDPGILLQAFTSLHFGKDAHLVIVGNGELEEELKKDYDDNQNIHFIDFQNQSQMPAIYGMATTFVLPSKGPGETWGLAVNEAMAHGKSVIVSDKCGCAIDLVEDGVNGYIFKAGNMIDLQNKMEALYLRKNILNDFNSRSLEKIQCFSLESLAASVETAVNNIL